MLPPSRAMPIRPPRLARRPDREEPLVDRCHLLRVLRPVVVLALHIARPASPSRSRRAWVFDQAAHGLCQRSRVLRRHQQAGLAVAHHVWDAVDVRRHDGQPGAEASAAATPKPSHVDGSTKTSSSLRKRGTSSCSSQPRSSTLDSRFRRWIAASMRGRSGPSPAMRRLTPPP